ncbi:cadmium-translocating P-type ATPase [Lysobacter sp. TY2-98]|uniref:heavy metal translocating P-type ATPase n=1 Tax=Lysobacter sp. TY2-98 TaxID=2290922 RepID=UPI000E1FBF7F|nr:heavy metal translocating P-type ATPase [Lysobacter sp. TY2-98]AXK73559.1 cadmium-translocating P-type ATPase [Lysobacter sp. TY2-98]
MRVAPASADAATGCWHCGEPLSATPAHLQIDDATRAFCCDGCAAAAQWIRDAHLDDYYCLRSERASRVGTEPSDFTLWDRDDVVAGHVSDVGGLREITVVTDGMRCAACAWLIDRALSNEPGVRDVAANAVTGRIRLTWDPAATPLSSPLQRLASLGYRPYLAGGIVDEDARRRARNRSLLRIGLASLGAMQAMMFGEALYLDTGGSMPIATRDFLRWITFLVSTPVVFYAGWPFLEGAWLELRHRRLGMDVLVATSTLLAYAASVVETVRGGPHVWYDAAVMFVFLLLVARTLEERARAAANAQVDALARARPVLATRELADGTRETVPIAALAVGDIACVAAGEPAPADGVLRNEEARFEEALLTGEPHAVAHRSGDTIFAGTICRDRTARVQVTRVGADTRLSELTRLVEQAQAHRPKLAQVADRIAGVFVIAMLLVAAVTFFVWRVHDPLRALDVTLAVLAISCPCALSLSMPAALAAAHGGLARIGLLATRPDALDRLARADDIVFDKTGTLTDGGARIASVETFGIDEASALRIAASLEQGSTHPLAVAFAAVDAVAAHDVRVVAGSGLEGLVGGRSWRIGRADFAAGRDDDDAVWLGDGNHAAARFEIGESLRSDAAPAIASLRDQRLRVHLASGDAHGRVDAIARHLSIGTARARQTPEDKLAYARELQRDGRVVAMVGDGVNDAPVIAGADVSIAIGGGAALAQRAADFVLTGHSLSRLAQAVDLARRTRRVIRQNLAWALGYNLLALPVAVTGHVAPWLAALGMSLSSLAVTLNALRLARRAA